MILSVVPWYCVRLISQVKGVVLQVDTSMFELRVHVCVSGQCVESWTATIPARELPHFKFRGAKDCRAPELELELRNARTEVWSPWNLKGGD